MTGCRDYDIKGQIGSRGIRGGPGVQFSPHRRPSLKDQSWGGGKKAEGPALWGLGDRRT
jgi:hypothetical protein